MKFEIGKRYKVDYDYVSHARKAIEIVSSEIRDFTIHATTVYYYTVVGDENRFTDWFCEDSLFSMCLKPID